MRGPTVSSIRVAYFAMVATGSLALAACGDSTVAPTANIATPNRPAFSVTIGTVPTVRRDLEGQYWVCKVANAGAPQETFNFTYSATKPVGSTQPDLLPGSFSIASGQCAMIYSINREIPVDRYTVTVTEGAMPNANWALTSASAYTITPPFNSTFLGTPVVNGQEVSGTGFIHDQGAVLTITNTYTPPRPSCTLTQGYWKNHQEEWDAQGERVVWTGQTFFKSGRTYAQIMAMNPSGGNSYIQLAHQYIAAKLNVNGGADPAIDASITQAESLFNSLSQGTTYIKNASWTSLATTLDNYNNGVTGPGHCN